MLHDFFASNPFRRIPLQARFKSGVAAVAAVVIAVAVLVVVVIAHLKRILRSIYTSDYPMRFRNAVRHKI